MRKLGVVVGLLLAPACTGETTSTFTFSPVPSLQPLSAGPVVTSPPVAAAGVSHGTAAFALTGAI